MPNIVKPNTRLEHVPIMVRVGETLAVEPVWQISYGAFWVDGWNC